MVRVPTPERFAVHKLIASQLRVHRDAKSEKDIHQACTLLAVLGEHHPGAIEAALERLPVSAGRHLRAALALARPLLESAHPRAWEAVSGWPLPSSGPPATPCSPGRRALNDAYSRVQLRSMP